MVRNNLPQLIRRGLLISVAAAMMISTLGSALPALAHNGVDHGDDAAHAKDDLADMSITEIEKATEQAKAKKRRETGLDSGAARRTAINGIQATVSPMAVSSNPGISGVWSPVFNTPVVPIFQAVLPNGKVLMWDSVGDSASEEYSTHNFTRAMVWDPITNTSKDVRVNNYNIFCAGFAHLENGNILVAGGNKNKELQGIVQTHIFNWRTETWSRGVDMKAGR